MLQQSLALFSQLGQLTHHLEVLSCSLVFGSGAYTLCFSRLTGGVASESQGAQQCSIGLVKGPSTCV
jgi:hypothetical protein